MITTKTGSFPVGFRQGWSDWQKDLPTLIAWAKANNFGVVDVGRSVADAQAVTAAGLQVGSIDLLEWQPMLSTDAAARRDAIAANQTFIKDAVAAGASKFFWVALPEDPALPRLQNYGYTVEALQQLAPTLEQHGGQLVIEGYPGAGALCCTPETYRAAFKEADSPAIGINYDPSHLLRMGIDPIRFLKEFVGKVGHVHGKDAEVLADDLYEYGWEQPATFKPNPDFGLSAWRYTLPGQGNTNWAEVFRILKANNYHGAVCIELEDHNYNGTEAGEKLGLINSASFLSSC